VPRLLSLAQEPSRGEARSEVTGETGKRSSELESWSVFFKQRPRDFLKNSATDFDHFYNSGTEPEINVSINRFSFYIASKSISYPSIYTHFSSAIFKR